MSDKGRCRGGKHRKARIDSISFTTCGESFNRIARVRRIVPHDTAAAISISTEGKLPTTDRKLELVKTGHKLK